MTTMLRRPILIALLAFAAAPGAAHASTSGEIHRECQSGTIARDHSAAELAAALRSIPTDLDEYTDCRDAIRRAQLHGPASRKPFASRSGTDAVGGVVPPSSTPPQAGGTAGEVLAAASPAEQAAVDDAVREAPAAVEVGGEQLSPVTAGYSPAGAANVVPTPLAVAAMLLGAGLAFGGLATVRTRILARRA